MLGGGAPSGGGSGAGGAEARSPPRRGPEGHPRLCVGIAAVSSGRGPPGHMPCHGAGIRPTVGTRPPGGQGGSPRSGFWAETWPVGEGRREDPQEGHWGQREMRLQGLRGGWGSVCSRGPHPNPTGRCFVLPPGTPRPRPGQQRVPEGQPGPRGDQPRRGGLHALRCASAGSRAQLALLQRWGWGRGPARAVLRACPGPVGLARGSVGRGGGGRAVLCACPVTPRRRGSHCAHVRCRRGRCALTPGASPAALLLHRYSVARAIWAAHPHHGRVQPLRLRGQGRPGAPSLRLGERRWGRESREARGRGRPRAEHARVSRVGRALAKQ